MIALTKVKKAIENNSKVIILTHNIKKTIKTILYSNNKANQQF